ncbi:MAG: R3H domain-containing nucleic acid-binding protein [Candidatus Paceibacterota bacterium]
MQNLQNKLQKIIELMGFSDFSISYDAEGSRFLIFLNEGEGFKKLLPYFVADLDYLVKLIAKKNDIGAVFVDVNNYRRERENLILELARAAARKSIATKEEVSLPIMNAYERRLVHLELVNRPDINTESVGEGKERRVVIKPI